MHYALKANANEPVLDEMRRHGFGADCVSGNEIKAAIVNGFAPEQVVFAGVGKSDDEINYALDQDIFCFNCESGHELEVLNELAGKKGKIARIALRINPNVNANTHKYITTGLEENKFGINAWELEQVLAQLQQLEHINLIGIHFHIGSQITDLSVFRNLCTRVNEFQEWFESRKIQLQHINVGGGLGVDYYHPEQQPVPDFEAYFGLFHQFLEVRPGQEVHFELGRAFQDLRREAGLALEPKLASLARPAPDKDPLLLWFGIFEPVQPPPPPLPDPRGAWADPLEYDKTAQQLVRQFIDNFAQFEDHVDEAVRKAAPVAA